MRAPRVRPPPTRARPSGATASTRITSYNVCYTKLLRSLPKDLFKGGLAISGVYDLRPLEFCDFLQPDLRLNESAALKVSPAYLPPATRAPVATCVGGRESSERNNFV